jgi:hypothetical protein
VIVTEVMLVTVRGTVTVDVKDALLYVPFHVLATVRSGIAPPGR